MESNHPDNDLLIKYLLNEVTTEEEAFVTEWMASDIRNQQEFETFEKIWILANAKDNWNDIDTDKEWQKHKEEIDNIQGVGLKSAAQAQWETNKEIETSGKRRIYKLFFSIAVAASVLLVLVLGWNSFKNDKVNTTNIAVVENTPKSTGGAALRNEINTTGKSKKIYLQDGTVVVLEDKSAISFWEPFTAKQRDVTLQGRANFKVAKDKNRPFTVYSNAIATTVLGTVFDVSSYTQSNTITVRLYEGKVVVNSSSEAKKKLKEAVYLTPGYELIYDKQTATTSVQKFTKSSIVNDTLENIDITNPDNLNIPKKNGSWYMFNNQPLSKVFDQLMEMYHAEIVYNKKDVQKLYFIGQFNKADSLEMILYQITKTNDLKLTINNDTFIISK